jgi:hypothetical protein
MQLDVGATIVIDTGSKYGSVGGVTCVWSHLNTPSSVTEGVVSMTALQGQQSAAHEGISYSWSYHPDNGLNMVITLSDYSRVPVLQLSPAITTAGSALATAER